jgi:phytoene desaturase
VGSSTVPGVGVPMVLISGRLAAERVERFAAEGR